MVHAVSAVAFAVMALNAASALAVPVEFYQDLAQREFDDSDLALREYDDYDFGARGFFDDFEERDFDDWEDIFERAPQATTTTSSHTSTSTSASSTSTSVTSTSTSASSTITAAPTTTTNSPSKTVTATVHTVSPTMCIKRNGKLRKVRKSKNPYKRWKARKEAKAKAKAEAEASSSSATATATSSAASSTITPPPKQYPKDTTVTTVEKVGKDGVTTVSKTIVLGPTPCADSKLRKRIKRILGDEPRSYYGEMDELD